MGTAIPFIARRTRAAIAATLALAAIAACQPCLPTTSPSPAPSAAGSTTPTTAAASATPGPTASEFAAASPLPAATVDSDMDPAAQTAIENLLASPELSEYLAAGLIHDGGVILYRTLAERTVAQVPPPPQPPIAPPPDWRRAEVERGGRQLVVRNIPDAPAGEQRARITVRYPQRGVLTFGNPQVRKPFVEIFERHFVFRAVDGAWQLAEASPIKFETQGGNSPVEITGVAVFRGDAAEPVRLAIAPDQGVPAASLPVFAPGEQVRLEVSATSRVETGVFVFAHLAGRRGRLWDNGTTGDRRADDGVYSSTFVVPSEPGVHHVGLDALDRRTFTPNGVYRAEGRGLSFRVQKPE